jgi:NADH-quinone oxidoreductase subunit M
VALVTSLVFAVGRGCCSSTSTTTTARRHAAVLVDKEWIDVINSRYIMGIDGISLPLMILTMLIVPLVIIYSWNHFPEPHNPKAFLILMLVLRPACSAASWPRTSSCSSCSSRSCCCRCTS